MFTLASDVEAIIGGIAVVGAFSVVLTAIVLGIWRQIKREKEREQTRREVAAYVAEGSMTAEDAQKILEAGTPIWQRKAPNFGKG